MSGSKGSAAPAQQTVTQKTELPQWVSDASQNNYTDAKNVAATLAAPYTGNQVAGFTPEQQAAWEQAGQASTAAAGSNAAAGSALSAAANYTPQQVTAMMIAGLQKTVQAQQIQGQTIGANTFSADALKPYLNPYTEQVVDAGLSDLERQRQLTQVTNGDKAASAGAFGGSRHAIQEGVTNAETARAAGTLSATLRDQAFNTAAGLLNTDNDRVLKADMSNQATDLAAKQSNQSADLSAQQSNQATTLAATKADQASKLSADQGNQSAGLTANAQKIAAASGLMGLGAQQFNQTLQQASVNEGIGAQLQALDQANLTQIANNYTANRNYPLEQLQIKQNALSNSPYGQSSTTTGPATQQGGNSLLGLLGGASTGASIASTLGLAGGGGGIAGAGLGGLVGLLAMSDRDEKTDIKRVGKDPETGLPLYSYRYKGDPKSYPKVVGPMAQDIEKRFPEMITKVPGTGKRAVNAGFLGGVMAVAAPPNPSSTPAATNPLSRSGEKGLRHIRQREARRSFLAGL